MGLSKEQRDDIRNFLLGRGLGFKPLLDEMADHVSCDLEKLMTDGLSYEDAWKQTITRLPEDHFIQIQNETMQTINQRYSLSRVFTYVGMAALFGAVIFKVMHLAGGGGLLIGSFGALALALITGSVAGIYFNRDKDGALRVLAVVTGVLLLQAGYAFRLLHLTGATQLVALGVTVLLVAMIVNTMHVYKQASGSGNLFTFLHDKYSPGIERFILIISPLLVFTELKLVHLVVIFAAGLQFFALLWTNMEKDPSRNNIATAAAVILACMCFITPMLGEIVSFKIRLILVTLFSFVGAFLVWRLEPSKSVASYLVSLSPIMFFMLAIMKMGWMISFADNFAVNIIVVAALVAGIFFSPKMSIARTFMIISLAGYLLEL
jgi:hypothetical protein